jgi:hypothetical protein
VQPLRRRPGAPAWGGGLTRLTAAASLVVACSRRGATGTALHQGGARAPAGSGVGITLGRARLPLGRRAALPLPPRPALLPRPVQMGDALPYVDLGNSARRALWLSAGHYHSCVILAGLYQVYCWWVAGVCAQPGRTARCCTVAVLAGTGSAAVTEVMSWARRAEVGSGSTCGSRAGGAHDACIAVALLEAAREAMGVHAFTRTSGLLAAQRGAVQHARHGGAHVGVGPKQQALWGRAPPAQPAPPAPTARALRAPCPLSAHASCAACCRHLSRRGEHWGGARGMNDPGLFVVGGGLWVGAG